MPKSRITSRMAKKQKQEFTKQSIYLIFLSIAIGLFFVAFLLPNAVRLFFRILDQQTDVSSQQAIPPQPPTVHLPDDYTNKDKISITGYADSNSKLRIEVNNQTQDTVNVDDSGEFEIELRLSEGENIIRLYSINDDDLESMPRRFSVIRDSTEPDIHLFKPEDGQEFRLREEQVILIEGETKPRSRVYLNDRLVYADSAGIFSFRHQLNDGENKLSIKVVDQAGNEAERELTVNYRF